MAIASTSDRTSYDEVPYDSFPFAQSHPNRLATIAKLFGMQPAPLATCRVLELGCAAGGNLIPLAATMPQAHFKGVDASQRQIAQGSQTIEQLALANIELLHLDILDFDKDTSHTALRHGIDGELLFDYIICHGVYSWVPDSVQSKILDICSQYLSPQGVAYISYNTNPGWRMRGMIRDLMSYRADFFETPDTKTQEARALLDFLAAAVPQDNNPYGMLLNSELQMLRTKADHYLFHEHLEEHNEPVYFHQFIGRAAAQKLQYLGEAEYSMMAAGNFSPNVAAMVRRLASSGADDRDSGGKPRVSADARRTAEVDPIQLEQYMDFVRNRMFRQTLLCRADVALDRNGSPECLLDMHIASPAKPDQACEDLHSPQPVVFRRPGSSLTTAEPLVKAAMISLREAWPASVSFDDLLTLAIEKLAPGPVLLGADRYRQEAMRIAHPLLNCYGTGHVDVFVEQFPFSVELGEYPEASPLARHQAIHSNSVTTLAHSTTQLNDLERRLLPLVDGQHNQAMLVSALRADVEDKRLVLRDKGGPVTSDERATEILNDMVAKQLHTMAMRCLLLRN